MHTMIIKNIIILICTSEKNRDKSGKSQGILISCVSGNPALATT